MERVYAAVDIGAKFPSITKFDTVGSLVTVFVQNAFALAGVAAFILLVFAGFGMIQAAGAGDAKKMESGKKAITGAVLGLVFIIGSIWIMQVIQTITGMSGQGVQILPTLK